MKTEAINKMAMDLVGDLQMVPVEQAYDRVKKYLNDAWELGAEETKRVTAQPNAPDERPGANMKG